MAEAYIFINID